MNPQHEIIRLLNKIIKNLKNYETPEKIIKNLKYYKTPEQK
jgi:hypothetical protein